MRIVADHECARLGKVNLTRPVEELNRIRDVLKQNNIDSALVKVRESQKHWKSRCTYSSTSENWPP